MTASHCPVDEETVERCARAARDAGRCSPPWDSAAWQPKQTYLRSTRAVLATYLDGRTVVEDGRLARLVAATTKLRTFARSVIRFGGSVPEAEALTDADVGVAS